MEQQIHNPINDYSKITKDFKMPPIVEETQLEGPRMTKLTCLQSSLPLVFAIAAIILGTTPALDCETVRFTQSEGNDGLVLLAGPLSYRTQDASEWTDLTFVSQSCRNYGSLEDNVEFRYETDAKTKAVWVFSILTPLLGACLILKAFFACMCGSSMPGFNFRGSAATTQRGWKCLGACFVVTSAFQGLTLLIRTSSICDDNPALQYLEATNTDLANTFPESCDSHWATGFVLQVAAVVLWALAGLSVLASDPPLVIHEHPQQNQTVTYTQTECGTVEETRVTIVKGSPVEVSK